MKEVVSKSPVRASETTSFFLSLRVSEEICNSAVKKVKTDVGGIQPDGGKSEKNLGIHILNTIFKGL